MKIGDFVLYQYWDNYQWRKSSFQITKICRKYVYGKAPYMNGIVIEGLKCAKENILQVKEAVL